MDLNFDVVQHAPQIKHVAKHVSHVAHAAPIIKQGISMLTTLISSAVSLGIGFGLGWYIKGRGMTGVQIDINNIKNDIENLKAKLSGSSTPAPVAA